MLVILLILNQTKPCHQCLTLRGYPYLLTPPLPGSSHCHGPDEQSLISGHQPGGHPHRSADNVHEPAVVQLLELLQEFQNQQILPELFLL